MWVAEQGVYYSKWDDTHSRRLGKNKKRAVPIRFLFGSVMPCTKATLPAPASGHRSPEPHDHWREPILCQNVTEILHGSQKIIKYEISDHCSQNKVSSPGQSMIYIYAKCYKKTRFKCPIVIRQHKEKKKIKNEVFGFFSPTV